MFKHILVPTDGSELSQEKGVGQIVQGLDGRAAHHGQGDLHDPAAVAAPGEQSRTRECGFGPFGTVLHDRDTIR